MKALLTVAIALALANIVHAQDPDPATFVDRLDLNDVCAANVLSMFVIPCQLYVPVCKQCMWNCMKRRFPVTAKELRICFAEAELLQSGTSCADTDTCIANCNMPIDDTKADRLTCLANCCVDANTCYEARCQAASACVDTGSSVTDIDMVRPYCLKERCGQPPPCAEDPSLFPMMPSIPPT